MDFNGEVLARKRKKLRLSLASVASQLTLSHEQINSIEKLNARVCNTVF
jgi:transcriptional regulator with XRE-family HTH domain